MPSGMPMVCRDCQRSLQDIGGVVCPGSVAEPELQEYDCEDLKEVNEYKYTTLPSGKKRIRLMKLQDSSTSNAGIYCEFIEAEYDNFHIPKLATDEETETTYKLPEEYQDDIEAYKKDKLEQLKKKRDEKKNKSKKQRDEEEKQANKDLDEEWEKAWDHRVNYDALSWCWGTSPPQYALMVRKGEVTYKLKIKRELALALKYLRYRHKTRILWVDAVCINQANPSERNHQVQMMSRIYTRARMVCNWLGEHTEDSKIAIEFIRKEVMELRNIETLCTEKRYTRKWQALQMLMQTEWFSRRWVVQEIALAKQAVVCCGADLIPWKDFAIAVELFVEVETATHRLSEIMQNDEKFRYIPNWFDHVSELGASLLVQATGKVFRGRITPLQDDKGEEQKEEQFKRWKENRTTDLLERRSLLSLEYLVSTMFIFKATEPRDVVYSLLAIARDAAPFAGATFDDADPSYLTMRLFEQFLEEKPFLIDYSRPYPDVCRDFVMFVIQRKNKIDAVQALDILCRPWSLEQPKETDDNKEKEKAEEVSREKEKRKGKLQKEKEEQLRQLRLLNKSDENIPDDRSSEKYWKSCTTAFQEKKECNELKSWCTEYKKGEVVRDVKKLPSWVARASRAPFILDSHPGMSIKKVGRANADPLVGPPTDGHRNYNAAQTRPVNLEVLKFRRRPELGHYSMYVQGFVIDEVVEVKDASSAGDIPRAWLELGGWKPPFDKDPPDDLWRTLVADRGRDNRNPPYYYARACRESAQKGNINSGRIATMSLINNERNSIITEFCRRVHAVIWNRRMFKTKADRLGLAYDVNPGDKICVLYGCTVPVVLRKEEKKRRAVDKERQADMREALKSCIRHCEENYDRKQWLKRRRDKNWRKWVSTGEWFEMLEDKEKAEARLKLEKEIRKEKEKKEGEDGKGEEEKGEQERKQEKDDQTEQSEEDGRSSQEGPDPSENMFKKRAKKEQQDDLDHFYEFQGDCYLHGMMDGEAVREKFYGELLDKVFELR
ncbi:hypothetical protein PG999_001361 [Apiospora kogelbergensis]|uniref:Heterokaryon incompatibility domain-containing protein n=1 Tax=Apiospora kogelbergensis TaxID=1337665 RepID=A0AAW0REB6_9PEZI